MQRDRVTREEVLARMNKQMDESIQDAALRFCIENDEQELLLPQVIALHENCRA